MTEVRSVSSTGAEKGTKDERFDLIPTDALAKVARHFGVGARKYADHNWRKGYEWSKSYAAMQRHAQAFWGGEDIDEETGSPHMAAVAFHSLALLTYMDEHREFDDRYKRERPRCRAFDGRFSCRLRENHDTDHDFPSHTEVIA